jgi:hypothetical protein
MVVMPGKQTIQILLNDKVKKDEVGGACEKYGR